ncbi:F-box/LRR-repeat protein 6 isoform X2 [Candoia aspera]|uniref:F-box/LRR-repeat protein 6 isoform X2 n=1 Tax=Candoia aspera TaxID=51853 RepID=UPI002FD7A3C3
MRRGGCTAPPRRRRRRKGARGREGAPQFVVHETEEAALLLVPAAGEEGARGPRKKRRVAGGEAAKGEAAGGVPAPDSGWGARLPAELLVRVFGLAVAAEGGSVPFLCRAARVCRLWYRAASAPVLWRKVAVGHCWAPPGQKWPPALQKRALGTLEWLAARRFSHLRDFTLSHWRSHVPPVLQAIVGSCALLSSLRLSHCSGITTQALCLVAESCPWLVSLNLQGSQVDPWAVTSFLEVAGMRMQQLSLTYSSRMSAIIALLVGGCCPDLQLLEVNAEIKQSTQHFQLPIEQLQAASPQLQLEELCLATTAFSFVDDNMLRRILCTSSRLRVLDLRGCFRVTPKGLEQLPCPDLEQLYLGLHYSASHLSRPLEGSPLLTWKWRHSLRELDLAGQSFSEQDLERAMAAFIQGGGDGGAPVLCSLSLTGTKVALSTVSALIASCPALAYLNLSSCRHLPRGTKKAYRGPDEVRQCLHQLLTSLEEQDRLGGAA